MWYLYEIIMNEHQQKVYNALKKDGNLSLQKIADKTRLSVSGVKKI